MDKKTKAIKKRHWAMVIYPESLPENWKEILQQTGCEIAYILHDKDIEPTGEPKKPHYHVIMSYTNGTTTFNNVKRITDALNAPIPQGIESVGGYYRYLTHKDNPEKYQYDEKDIVHLNGFSPFNYIELKKGHELKLKQEILAFIKESGILLYDELNEYYMNTGQDLYFKVVSENTNYFSAILKAKGLKARWKDECYFYHKHDKEKDEQ
uniref:Plasmid replication initiation protein n=1 Tax=Mycoplasma capricolum subsp. capricolum TaxID=40479 RepID=K9RZV9_MYCCA|nr:replication protein [Mycoplasma capricolum]AFY63032.1 plasmid replication initiation protein [Mycoplasma capricolum subsp. capricolum]